MPASKSPFEFTPLTAGAAKVVGTLIVDPLTIGGDEAGANMTSDFEWAIVGTPTFTPATAGAHGRSIGQPRRRKRQPKYVAA